MHNLSKQTNKINQLTTTSASLGLHFDSITPSSEATVTVSSSPTRWQNTTGCAREPGQISRAGGPFWVFNTLLILPS